MRLWTSSFCMIAERWLRVVPGERWSAPASSATEEAEELSRADLEAHAANGLDVVVGLAKVVDVDCSHAPDGRNEPAGAPVAAVLTSP
jgi:hypothetical protein